MKKQAKLLATLISVSMLGASLAACAKDNGAANNKSSEPAPASSSASSSASASEAPPKEEPLKVNVLIMHTFDNAPKADNRMHQWLLENKNIDIQITTANTKTPADKMNTMLASGDIPDVVSILTDDINNGIANKWAEAGYIVDLDPWLSKYPDLLKYTDPDYNKVTYASKKDGKMYMIPGNPAANKNVMQMVVGPMIREDWLKQVGMAPPTTTDELYAVLKAFKEKIPDVNGKAIIPASFDNFRQLFMYSWTKNWFDLSEDNKTLNWWFNNPHIVDYMLFMNKLYKDGLLDKETITQQPAQYQAKLSSGRVGFTLNTNGPMDTANGVLKAEDPAKRFIPNPPIQVPGLPMPIYQESSFAMAQALTVSKKFAENTRNMERLMEFLNWSVSTEGATILSTGPDGEYYVKNADGLLEPKPEVKEQQDKADKSFETTTGIAYYNLLNVPVIPRVTVMPGTDEFIMAQKTWLPAVGEQNVPFNFSGTGPEWDKHWPDLWPEISKWEAKAIFADSEEEVRKITSDMLANFKKIGEPVVTAEKLKLIDEYVQKNKQ
ncbi:extracellular solute-binding protein [Cohnella sp. GCM10020058]|uniref:extracellular solute-binding protein n=1 Tax=Cohnella sp. GCM10020058 TaxID=3317330 RepID=UPI003637FD4E